jgi:hypothetical protein
VRIPVTDLEQGLAFYRGCLGHALIWRTEDAASPCIPGSETELVRSRGIEQAEVDWKVTSVEGAVARFLAAGGRLVLAPFDIPIGAGLWSRIRGETNWLFWMPTTGCFSPMPRAGLPGTDRPDAQNRAGVNRRIDI